MVQKILKKFGRWVQLSGLKQRINYDFTTNRYGVKNIFIQDSYKENFKYF